MRSMQNHPIQYRRALMEILETAADLGDRTESRLIAEKLHIEAVTVDNEWQQILKLLNVHSREDALRVARALGLRA